MGEIDLPGCGCCSSDRQVHITIQETTSTMTLIRKDGYFLLWLSYYRWEPFGKFVARLFDLGGLVTA